jgi:hypothetical protein
MKIRLKMNLTSPSGEILPMGTVLSNEDGDFPDFIQEELNDTRFIEITEHDDSADAPAAPRKALKRKG